MPITLKNWLFNQLPKRVKDTDTHINAQGEGLTQRYLQTFGSELDTEVIPFIKNISDILGLDSTPNKFLPYFGWNLGQPPNPTINDNDFRRLLSYIVAIYKVKGTLAGYQLLFNIFGLNANIVTYPSQVPTQYDSGYEYDSGYQYDITNCPPCTEYDLIYSSSVSNPVTGAMGIIDPALIQALKKIVCLIQPVNLKLRNFSLGLSLQQTKTSANSNDLTITTEEAITFDNGLTYDNSETYDTFVAVSTNNYIF